jgi:carbon-monoxide dehydrogenase medium subunit
LLATLLDAQVIAQNSSGARRAIPAEELFLGFFTTTLEPDELIVEVVFPYRAARAAITEYAQRKGDFATVAAAVDLDRGRVVLGGVAEVPSRIPEAEAVLAEGGTFAECAEAAAAAIDPPADANGSADYRRALTRTLVAEACEKAVSA